LTTAKGIFYEKDSIYSDINDYEKRIVVDVDRRALFMGQLTIVGNVLDSVTTLYVLNGMTQTTYGCNTEINRTLEGGTYSYYQETTP
jgi:hypothetical protein